MENYVSITSSIPSKCIVYPEKTELSIRTFKGRDEKLIAEITAENFEKKFLIVLRNVFKGIDPAKLTMGDRLYLAIWESINSFSKDFYMTFECEHCWQKSDYTVDLSKLEIIELPADFKEPYEIKLPESGEMIKLRLLRLEDLIKIDDLDKQGQNVWLYRYALSIINDKGIWDNVTYLEDLSSKDLMVIRGFHDQFYHGPKMETKYECPKCGGGGVMPVPFRLEMLLPHGEKLKRYLGGAV